MSLPEIIWRFSQKRLYIAESKRFSTKKSVCSEYFYGDNSKLLPNWNILGLNISNQDYELVNSIQLIAGYNYEEYKTRWHAGFQTDFEWPIIPSYQIRASADNVPGDLRTNWDLNRHYQFTILAKCFYISKDLRYLNELIALFDDWNDKNPFLWGPEWTSAMEIAIRLINWVYTAAFLVEQSKIDAESEPDALVVNMLAKISVGCANMAAYIEKHRSQFSSANNHSIVEASALGIAGYVYGMKSWKNTAFKVLDEELERQIFPDGVNKEQSLHYQTFSMEAYALFLHVSSQKEFVIPDKWLSILSKCCDYVCDCKLSDDCYLEFGDNDEGSILNFSSVKPCHPEYILAFMSLVLDGNLRWVNKLDKFETLRWLIPQYTIVVNSRKPVRAISHDTSYIDGGVTIMRSKDGRVVVGVDHGPLGFGSLAAHGHADALSFQLYVDGFPAFVDPGTYNYNFTSSERNRFRSTSYHNTILVNGQDQSEMLGPFLWGKQAKSRLVSKEVNKDEVKLMMEANYEGIKHVRNLTFNLYNFILIQDEIYYKGDAFELEQNFLVGSTFKVSKCGKDECELNNGDVCIGFSKKEPGEFKSAQYDYSPSYGKKMALKKIYRKATGNKYLKIQTSIRISR